ncbi:hypothetical protein T03_9400 [Trichinella britovi]|uniref:Uncharacterized protein n=1 Tax=Trichinella britovi TaxID=45882 RepID=A0A0V1CVT0_TRIBR|nr:hypothetical protein T03_9400 [Trichinella britovi]
MGSWALYNKCTIELNRQSCNVTGRIKCWMLTAGRPNAAASSHVSHSDSIQHPLTNRWAIAIGRLTLTVICAFFCCEAELGHAGGPYHRSLSNTVEP